MNDDLGWPTTTLADDHEPTDDAVTILPIGIDPARIAAEEGEWWATIAAEESSRIEDDAERYQFERRVGEVADRLRAKAAAEARLQAEAEEAARRAMGAAGTRYVDGATFVLDAPEQIPALWGSGEHILWSSGEALMIVGPAGLGKTTIAGQLVAARLGLGECRLLGQPVVPGARRVLYIAADRPEQTRRSLRRTLIPAWRDALAERLTVWKGPPAADFAKQTSLLRDMCVDADADTVIIDSLKDVAIGLSEDDVGASYNRARQLAIVNGVEVIELHHQRKTGANGAMPNSLSDVYGSTWITAGAGSVVLLWGQAGDPVVRMVHLKQPAEEMGPWNIVHDHRAGRTTVQHDPDLAHLAASKPGGVTAWDVAKILFETEKPSRAQKEKARRRLETLVEAGRLMSGMGRAGSAGGDHEARTYHAVAEEEKS